MRFEGIIWSSGLIACAETLGIIDPNRLFPATVFRGCCSRDCRAGVCFGRSSLGVEWNMWALFIGRFFAHSRSSGSHGIIQLIFLLTRTDNTLPIASPKAHLHPRHPRYRSDSGGRTEKDLSANFPRPLHPSTPDPSYIPWHRARTDLHAGVTSVNASDITTRPQWHRMDLRNTQTWDVARARGKAMHCRTQSPRLGVFCLCFLSSHLTALRLFSPR
jgi:hypothetical protein